MLRRLLVEHGGASGRSIVVGALVAASICIGGYAVSGGGGSCAWPSCFPDASNTGVPSGTTLTAYTGPTNITTNNTVIDSKTISSELTISASGVVIKNSVISCACGLLVLIDDAGTYALSNNATEAVLTIQDSELSCQDTPGSSALSEANYTVVRSEITHCENGLDINQNVSVTDSFIHDLYNGGASHADGAQFGCGHWEPGFTGPACASATAYASAARNVTFEHNTVWGMGDGDTTFGTSAFEAANPDNHDFLIQHNLIAGGAYSLYCPGDAGPNNFSVIDNSFSTVFSQTYNGNDNVGAFGPSDSCLDETLSGNIYYPSGSAITLP